MNKRKIFVFDPPWNYRTWSGKNQTRNADNHYGTMTDQELLDLDAYVQKAAGPEAICCMWCTASNMPFALKLMKQWGFEYKTILFTWVKLNKSFQKKFKDIAQSTLNMPPSDEDLIKSIEQLMFVSLGHWTRSNCEFVIVGKRGKIPLQRLRKDVRQLVISPVTEHSRKPDEVNKRIESMLRRPQDKCYEFFARRQYNDWYCTGNELDGLDIKDALMNIIADNFAEYQHEQQLVLSGAVDQSEGETIEQQAFFVD